MAEVEKRRVTPSARAVVLATALLWLCPLVVAASRDSFWERQHSTAPVAGGLIVLLVIAMLRRHQWAWALLLIFEVSEVVGYAVALPDFPWFLINVATLALLLSPQMRGYVGFAARDRRAGV